jgi:nucleotide-binding universal stress UspA family protein
MPKSILVGFDPRTSDHAPVRFGVAAARFLGIPLIVGAVYADAVVVGQMGHSQMDEELADDATAPLRHVELKLREEGVRAECRALPGTSVPATLHNAAESLGAAMLVVGSTQRGPRSRVLTGSTAERLMHGAPCPVAVVPGSWEPGGGLETVGVAFAETPEGREALDSGLVLARRAGAKVRVLSAVKSRHFGGAAGGRPGHERSTFDAVGSDEAKMAEEIRDEAARLESGVEVETDISAQDAAEFLVAASEHVDLLVCGSRGYGPRRAVLLGGVSRKVTAAARCPVIVLARGTETGLREILDADAGVAA